ncbi:MAG: hypothetical protein KY475_14880 [Planctomycetes bacterium]|nr:hypothetical protein [Planctomycetota bacterium]
MTRRTHSFRRRRGVAVVLVLGLLGVTLAVFYAMTRTHVASLEIQENFDRRGGARQAALAGMAAALRRLHDADWAEAGGADLALSGGLGDGLSYQATYATGDASLTAGDPDYAEYPFRLTITSTGYAIDPSNPSVRSEHTVETVVQLVRRAMPDEPAAWKSLRDDNYTLYQWADQENEVRYPVRIEGPVNFGGSVNFCENNLQNNRGFKRYLADLEAMRQQGLGDHRPFSGPVHLPKSQMKSPMLSLMTSELNLDVIDSPPGGAAPVLHPGSPTGYRLYPGGEVYQIPRIQSEYGYVLSGVTLEADEENPLGVFRSDGPLYLQNSATIRGTVIIDRNSWLDADLRVTGTNVALAAPDLPPLYDQPADERIQLPAAIVADGFRADNAKATIAGMVIAWETFQVVEEDEDNGFVMTGCVACEELSLDGRETWANRPNEWNDFLEDFEENLDDPNPIPYMPSFLAAEEDMHYDPKPTIRPDSGVTYHWHDWSQPLYVPHPDDAGLVWDLIRWTENP